MAAGTKRLAWWTVAAPVLGAGAVLAGKPHDPVAATLIGVVLIAAVLAAVQHAEIIAHAVGEPLGTLVLALAVTVIETSLIVSIMLSEAGSNDTLARDTVFSAMMIVLNGIVGLCLLVGARRHHEQTYNQNGVSAGLAMLSTLLVLTLILPNVTTSVAGPAYSTSQLVFVSVVSLLIYGVFVFAQTVLHREDFIDRSALVTHDGGVGRGIAWSSFALMLVALVAVVLLAKALSPTIQAGVAAAGAPREMVSIIIALLVLLPEGVSAVAAARQDRLQTSLNLAIGSALATIAMTIPAVAVTSILLGFNLVLGLSEKDGVLLVLTLFVSSLSLSTGRTTIVQGAVHLVLFATFLFITLVP